MIDERKRMRKRIQISFNNSDLIIENSNVKQTQTFIDKEVLDRIDNKYR